MLLVWLFAAMGSVVCNCSPGRCVSLRTPNSPFMCVRDTSADVYVVGSIIRDGLWEAHIVHEMVRALKRHPNAIMLDIGAHLGQYGIVAASMHRTVVAVDANPDNIRHLRASVRVNGFGDRMHIHNLGVDRTGGGYVRADGPKDNVGGWGTTACKNHKDPGCVPTSTVDEVVTQSHVDFGRRFIMKMDIEGHEPGAMAGARRVLDHTDVIFMEWSKQEGYVQMFDQLQSHGFRASCGRANECPWDVVWTRV